MARPEAPKLKPRFSSGDPRSAGAVDCGLGRDAEWGGEGRHVWGQQAGCEHLCSQCHLEVPRPAGGPTGQLDPEGSLGGFLGCPGLPPAPWTGPWVSVFVESAASGGSGVSVFHEKETGGPDSSLSSNVLCDREQVTSLPGTAVPPQHD